jgi:alanine dehydrogenase
MNIVILKERMSGEGRVALTPDYCLQLKIFGHRVFVEAGAGRKSGYADADYRHHGAEVVPISEIIPFLSFFDTVALKVKQPLPEDDVWFSYMKNGMLFAYFHSTGESDRHTIDTLLKQNITAISYEMIEENGYYPILAPMSKIAGRLAVEDGMMSILKSWRPFSKDSGYIQMVVFGAGAVGSAAVEKGLGLGFSSIRVFDTSQEKAQAFRRSLTEREMDKVKIFSVDFPLYQYAADREVRNANMLVGAVLTPGGHAPIVVSREQVESMGRDSVIVDVACDQGGCIWHPESETAATFRYQEKTFCRTPNMPGRVPKESTPLLARAIFPYLLLALDSGVKDGLKKDTCLRKGLLTYSGKIMNEKAAAYWNE